MQTTSSTSWKEQRRLRAYEMKKQGWKQRDIASALGVTKGAVSQWIGGADQRGTQTLQAKLHTGRPAELTLDQKREIPDLLSHGAEAYGFRGDVWTCPRISRVIEWEYGVAYHKSHVARILKELKWTPQMPLERAQQRDDAAIAAWRAENWNELKKGRVWSAEPWFSWMNRASTCCQRGCERTRPWVRHRSCVSFRRAITCLS